MEQARPDSTLLPAAEMEVERIHDSSHDRDARITRMLTTAKPPISVMVDPVHALIEQHRDARDACEGLDDGRDDEAYNDAHDRRRMALERVEAARPSTLPGLLALARHMDAYLRADAGGQDYIEPTTSGQALSALMNACLRLQETSDGSCGIRSQLVEPALDPVFAAIERHRAAFSTFSSEMGRIAAGAGHSAKGSAVRTAQRQVARNVYRPHVNALVAVRPITPAGLLAFTAYLASHDHAACEPALESWNLAKAINTIAVSMGAMMPSAPVDGTVEGLQPSAPSHPSAAMMLAFIQSAEVMLDRDLFVAIWDRAHAMQPSVFAGAQS